MGRSGRFGKYGDVKRRERLSTPRPKDKGLLTTSAGDRRGKPSRGKERSHMTIGVADSGDLPFVCDLSRRTFCRYGPYEEILPRWFTSGSSVTIVAKTQVGPVGFAMMAAGAAEQWEDGTAEIMAIAVEPARQGQGVGLALMETLERKARQASIRRLILHTATDNMAAKALFFRLGFEGLKIRRGFYPLGQDALMMFKVLNG